MSRTAEKDDQPPATHSDDHAEYLWIDEIIRGDFREGKIRKLRTSRCIPNRKLSIFISSTFTDTYRERNCLHEVILPQLQVQFQEYNIQIIFSDMRFGIKDENTLDQMTWILCAQEIERCFEESDGMFFLSLQGNKYGYMPLPKLINKLDFETRLHSLGDPDLVELVKEWYSFDDNNLISHYELKNLESLNDSNYYSNVLPAIRDKAFDELSFDLPELKINRSITEWESLYALHFDPKRVYWMKRELTFDPDRKDLYLFNDVAGDSSRGEKLRSLVDVLSQQLSPLNNIHACQQQISMTEYVANDEGCQEYLKEWREHVQTRLREVIAEIIGRIARWEANCSGYQDDLKIPGFHMSEILHHCRMASKKASIFLGRESLVENCLALIRAHSPRQQQRQHRPSTIPKTSKGRDPPDESLALDSVCLALVGRSGSGKTALMAKLAFLLYRDSEAQPDDHLPVIVRFCGTSRGSIHAIDLIQSITLQLLLVYKAKEEVVSFLQRLSASPAASYSEAVEAFHAAMSSYPAILLLDSLDQLSNVNEARSRLSFLLNMKSRVIVSTLPDETSTVRLRMLSTEDQSTSASSLSSLSSSSLSSSSVGYCYLCETRLKEKNVPTIQVPSYENQPRAAVVALVHGLLTQRNRRISDSQLETVLTAIQPEPSILYIHLAMEIVSQWKGNQQQVELKSTVIGVIHQIFDSLERQFGSHLTRYSFAFLTYAREGVSDSEMQDLLSLCPAVMAEVFQYSRLETVCRLPIHLWLRIKGAISGLAVERLNNCLSWFHRQLKETSLERFKDLRREVHEILGKHFCSLLGDSVYGKQMILHQPLLFTEVPVWFHASKINNRRVIEGSFHLVQAAVAGEDPENNAQLLVAAVNEICSMEFICASSLHGDLFHQLTVLQTISSRHHCEGVSDTSIVKRLRDYLSWLTKQATTITENPRRKVLSTALQEPAESTVWVDATRVIDRESFAQRTSDWARGDLWARERPFFFRTEAGLLSRLVGHTGAVVCVQWSPSGDRIASASSDQLLKLWDPLTGQVLVTCESHREAIKAIDWHPSGLFFASGGAERQAFLWDIVTGAKVSSLPMEKIAANTTETSAKSYQWITSLAWHPLQKSVLACGLGDGSIKVWDVFSSQLLGCFENSKQSAGWVKSIVWDSQGVFVAGGYSDKTIKVWHFQEKSLWRVLKGHSEYLNAVAFHPHQPSLLASGSEDRTVRLWELEAAGGTGKQLQSLRGHGQSVQALAWNRVGDRLASGSLDRTVRIWRLENSLLVSDQVLKGQAPVLSLSWHPAGERIAVGGEDQTISFWLVQSPREEAQTAPAASIESSQELPEKEEEPVKGTEVAPATPATIPVPVHVLWHAHLNQVAVLRSDGDLQVWDSSLSSILSHISVVHPNAFEPSSLAWAHDGKRFAVSFRSSVKEILLYDHPETNPSAPRMKLRGDEGSIHLLSFQHDGAQLISVASDRTIQLWDLATGKLTKTLKGHSERINCLALNRFLPRIASAGNDNLIKVWHATTGVNLATLQGHKGGVTSALWLGKSETNHQSLLVSASSDTTIKLWNLSPSSSPSQGYSLLRSIKADQGPVTALHHLPGSDILVSISSRKLRFWQLQEAKLTQLPDPKQAESGDWAVVRELELSRSTALSAAASSSSSTVLGTSWSGDGSRFLLHTSNSITLFEAICFDPPQIT